MQAVQAQVVGPALEHGELRTAAQLRMQCVHGPGQVALDQLPLEGEGRRGDDHALAVGEGHGTR